MSLCVECLSCFASVNIQSDLLASQEEIKSLSDLGASTSVLDAGENLKWLNHFRESSSL